jgi:hypothetical protein
MMMMVSNFTSVCRLVAHDAQSYKSGRNYLFEKREDKGDKLIGEKELGWCTQEENVRVPIKLRSRQGAEGKK